MTPSFAPWTNKYVGLPFQDKGRGPEAFDCWGLVRHVLQEEYGIPLPSYSEGYEDVSRAQLANIQAAIQKGLAVNWNRVEAPSLGDMIVFRIAGRPLHVGLVLEAPYFLHAHEGFTSRIERWDNHLWANRIEGFFRHDSQA